MKISLPVGYDNRLIWWPELGMGYHPQEPMSYEDDYWEKYLEYDKTEMGTKLTEARCRLVNQYTTADDLVDIGIGGGLFVRTMDCCGYDINNKANEWLLSVGRYRNPHIRPVKAISCWDSLEHIPNPIPLLNNVKEWVFASIPVFDNGEQVTKSKHYRPGEHIWYWTHAGFVNYMYHNGFKLMGHTDVETQLGREDILSYAFKRINNKEFPREGT